MLLPLMLPLTSSHGSNGHPSAAVDMNSLSGQLCAAVDMATTALQAVASLQSTMSESKSPEDVALLENKQWTLPSSDITWSANKSNRYRYEFAQSILTKIQLLQTSLASEDLEPLVLLQQLKAMQMAVVQEMKHIRIADDPKNPFAWKLVAEYQAPALSDGPSDATALIQAMARCSDAAKAVNRSRQPFRSSGAPSSFQGASKVGIGPRYSP